MATSTPSRASWRAIALPIPRLPPVTMAVLPVSSRSIDWPPSGVAITQGTTGGGGGAGECGEESAGCQELARLERVVTVFQFLVVAATPSRRSRKVLLSLVRP